MTINTNDGVVVGTFDDYVITDSLFRPREYRFEASRPDGGPSIFAPSRDALKVLICDQRLPATECSSETKPMTLSGLIEKVTEWMAEHKPRDYVSFEFSLMVYESKTFRTRGPEYRIQVTGRGYVVNYEKSPQAAWDTFLREIEGISIPTDLSLLDVE